MSALRKNVAGQHIGFCLNAKADGTPVTAGGAGNVVIDGGSQSACAGTFTHKGTGQWDYAPTQAETNGSSIAFAFTGTAAIQVGMQFFTIGYDPTLANVPSNVTQLLGTAWLTPGTAGTPDVNAKLLGGTAQTGRDIGASVLLSAGSGAGQLDFTSGVVKANATQWLGGTIPAVNVTGVPLVDLKYTLGTISPAAAGSVAIDWAQISNKSSAVNLSATQIQSVNNLASGSDSINTIATSGSTLTTGSTVSGSFASTAALDGVYWQIADSAGTLDMYFEFNVGATGAPTTAVWTGGLTTALNTLKVFAFNWAGSSWDQVGTLNGTTSLVVNNAQYDFTTAHVGTGGNLGLVRLRFQNTGLTTANFYTDQVLCGFTNVLSAALIATGVWQDATAGDFTVASSIGKSLFTSGNAPGAASGLSLVGSNMGTVTSVSGNVGGSVASVTARVTANTDQWNGTGVGTIPPDAIFIRSGTAQGGGASTITLDAGASATNNLYQNETVFIRSGTGAGQSAIIASYVGSTKVATIASTWATNPDNTSVFTVASFGPVQATVSGTVNANLTQVNGHAVTDTASGVLDVNSKNLGGTAQTGSDVGAGVNVLNWGGVAVNALIQGKVDAITSVRTGTAQAGAATTITLDSGASATDGTYKDMAVVILAGTGAGQSRLIQTYVGATKVVTTPTAWATNPDNTSVFAIVPSTGVDVRLWNDAPVLSTTAGVPDVNAKNIANVAAVLDANNFLKVDAEDWKGATAPAMTGDAFARLGAPAGASVSADIAALKADLDAGVTVTTNNDKSGYSITSNLKKNSAQAAFQFVMTDATTHQPKTGLTVTATRNIDNAGFAGCANSVSEVASGWYTIALAASDVNGNDIALRFTAVGADDCDVKFKTQP